MIFYLVVIFDQELKTVSSSYCIRQLFKQNYRSEESLDSKPIEFYVPDLDELGIMRSFQQVARNGGQFIVDRYYTITEHIQYPFRDRICTFGYNSHVYTIHYNTKEYTDEEAQNAVINKTIQHAESSSSDRKQVLDYLYTLSNSGLDRSQQKLVESILNKLSDSSHEAVECLGKKYGFSWREQQVAELVAEGKTTAEIASVLYITNKTVDFHRANIRKKLHLDSRISLSAFLMSL